MRKLITIILIVLCSGIATEAAVPTWTVNPSNFSNSMIMVGTIKINGVETVDENDIVAAFINGEVRGVANIHYEAVVDRYMAYLLIYSNESSGSITFKMYDADADIEIDALNTSAFVINGSEGNLGAPVIWADVLLSDEASLTSFLFPEVDGNVVFGTNTIDIPVGNTSNLTDLTASFNQSLGSRVTVGGVEQISGLTINDFSSPLTYRVTSESGNQLTDFIVTVNKTNHFPTNILLSSSSISENNSINDVIGDLSASDDEVAHSFVFVNGIGSEDNGSFIISGTQLLAGTVFDFENKDSYAVRIEVTDGANQTFEKSLTVTITDVNESPMSLSLSVNSIGEDATIGSVIGTLSNTDPDIGDVHNYNLSGVLADNAFFDIDGSNLVLANSFNFETQSSFSIHVTVTDGGLNTFDQPLTISISDANDAPTDISLDNQSVYENLPFGTLIGNFSTDDEDTNDVHSYSLVAGAGDTNNASVLVSGSQLLVNSAIDFETTPSISIRLAVADASNSIFERSFTLTILDANDSPTDLILSNNTLAENEAVGYNIGELSVVDTDPTTTTYVFVDGQNDNSYFIIDGSSLNLSQSLDFEFKNEYKIDVIATDIDNQSVSNSFVITVSDVNESPTDLSLDQAMISEHATIGSVVGTLSNTDPDIGDSFVYTIVGTSVDDAFFEINGNNLISADVFNFEKQSSYSIQLSVTDASNNVFQKAFEIAVTDANDAPTDISLDNQSVYENLPFGTLIGNFSTDDEDTNDVHSYSLVAGAADTNNASVLVSGSQLLVNSAIDFETTPSLSIRLAVADASNSIFEQSFTLTILDANDSPTDLILSNNTLAENEAVGYNIGELSVVDTDPTTTTYVFVDGQNDNSYFIIDGSSLNLSQSLDFEFKNEYKIDVIATDIDNQSVSNSFVITVSDVNESPTDLSLDQAMISEHATIGSVVGTLSNIDPDIGDVHNYNIVGTSADDAFFEINGNNLISADVFNFEKQSSYSIQLSVTDASNNVFQKAFEIAVTDANDAPTDISLDNQSVYENLPFGTLIGNLSTIDEDANDVHSYSLIAGAGDTNNASVLVSGNQLLLNSSIDFETKNNLSIRIEVKDAKSAAIEKIFSIEVLDTNDSPTELLLTNTTLVENVEIGFVVGTFSVMDIDPTTTIYSFIDGHNDNDFFLIEEGEFKTSQEIDFEKQSQFTIDVLATDIDNQSIINRFVIEVTNINERPTDIVLSNNSIDENINQQRIIGNLSTIDQDNGDMHTYSLATGIENNDLFAIENNTLIALETFDFESNQSYLLSMDVTDIAGLVFNKLVSISVLDQNEAPIVANPIGRIEKENTSDIEFSVNNVFTDVDAEDAFTLSVEVLGQVSLPSGIVFDAENSLIQINSSVDLTSFEIYLTATDTKGLSTTDVIGVTINTVTGLDNGLVDIEIFPNPTTHFLKVNTSNQNITSYRIFDQSGNTIVGNVYLDNQIDVSDLATGLYLLELKAQDKEWKFRFIKI